MIIQFVPKENHLVARDYCEAISEQVLKVTGIRGIVDYKFSRDKNNLCTFNIMYHENAPAMFIGPECGVFCGTPVDVSVVAKISETVINGIVYVMRSICKDAPGLDMYQFRDVMTQVYQDAVQDQDQLLDFIKNVSTGGN